MILFYLNNLINIIIMFFIASFFFKKIEKRVIEKYKKNYINYEQTLLTISNNLHNETTIRHQFEEKLQEKSIIIYNLHGKLSAAEERLKLLNHYHQKCTQLYNELNDQIKLNHIQEIKLKELNLHIENNNIILKEKQKLFSDTEKRLKTTFENLAYQIFQDNGYKIGEQNQLTLNNILNPLREQLNAFKAQIQNHFDKEENSRHTLIYEIRNLHQLNSKITQETINLTQALKGNNKIQGNWGEIILTKALEAAGMREGHEFHSQTLIKQADGKKSQPDIIIHLPHQKDIIIDSKISLIAYERYFNSKHDKDKQIAITEHIASLRSHIKSLNKKNYQKLFGLHTLDYILMFIPIESAFIIAIEKEPTLLTEAMNQNIMMVSPTTLLIALRTINNLWRHENQNHHAKKIADKAGRLYDKLKLFVDDLNKIGLYLNKTEIIYNAAKNKFLEGKGNIISQVEKFREFGVQIKQPITSTNHIKTSCSLIKYDKKNETNKSLHTEIKTIN